MNYDPNQPQFNPNMADRFPNSPWWPKNRGTSFADEVAAFDRVYRKSQALLAQDNQEPITDRRAVAIFLMEICIATQAISQAAPRTDAEENIRICAIGAGRQISDYIRQLIERIDEAS
ncbi:MAG: hypothetical protein WDN28_07715 [Chthoniobacter sp.]